MYLAYIYVIYVYIFLLSFIDLFVSRNSILDFEFSGILFTFDFPEYFSHFINHR